MTRCDGIHRREFLRVGSLAAFGLGISDVLRLRAQGSLTADGRADEQTLPRASQLPNCILIWLDGGPSHLDTFDLKPEAPAEVRGDFKPTATCVPGVHICEHFRRLATV